MNKNNMNNGHIINRGELVSDLSNENLNNKTSNRSTREPLKYIGDIVAQIACVYVIKNTYHNRFYIGQTTDMRNRIFDHSTGLMKGKRGSNIGMRKDFLELEKLGYDPYDYFTCEIVFSTIIMKALPPDDYSKLISTLFRKETNLLNKYRSQGLKVYNETKAKKRYKKPLFGNLAISRLCRVNGRRFDSIEAAARYYNISATSVNRYLKDPKKPTWEDLALPRDTHKTKRNKTVIVSVNNRSREIKFNDPVINVSTVFKSLSKLERHLRDIKDNVSDEDYKKYDNFNIFYTRTYFPEKCDDPSNPYFEWP